MTTTETLDGSLDRVRSGLERRVAALGGRVGDHLASYVGQPGKLLRARYTLLLGRALGVEPPTAESAARAVELVHNASLLHDDCIDEGLLRRGVPTPNALFGDRTGILLGDLAFTQGMAEAALISAEAVRSLVEAVQEMTVGELQEEFLKGSLNVSAEGYYGVAARKTSALFKWAGRVLSEESPLEHDPDGPPRLGVAAGILLQIVDDIHDFTLSEAVAGKAPGQDLHNGRLTLPGILAMDDDASRARWTALWGSRQPAALDDALALLGERGHLDAARAEARRIMEAMLPWVDALPVRAPAGELREFMTLMFRREF
ncbi:MAG: polyprenyl synthetase family protein [Elusimicrobia bacterium]|nr:polyprenyl synthetase family protein [Elusimicrobiota bacterium]